MRLFYSIGCLLPSSDGVGKRICVSGARRVGDICSRVKQAHMERFFFKKGTGMERGQGGPEAHARGAATCSSTTTSRGLVSLGVSVIRCPRFRAA
jgi:hypothetical protein